MLEIGRTRVQNAYAARSNFHLLSISFYCSHFCHFISLDHVYAMPVLSQSYIIQWQKFWYDEKKTSTIIACSHNPYFFTTSSFLFHSLSLYSPPFFFFFCSVAISCFFGLLIQWKKIYSSSLSLCVTFYRILYQKFAHNCNENLWTIK